jgi:hypothetical protein
MVEFTEGREEYGGLDEGSDIPFCLFLTLAKLFNRAPSTGANGCRLRVAMVEKNGLVSPRGVDRRGAADTPTRAPGTTQLLSELTRAKVPGVC